MFPFRNVFAVAALLAAAGGAVAETVVDVTGIGAEKTAVFIDVQGEKTFAESLKRNLDMTGSFRVVGDSSRAAVRVTGATGSSVRAEGRGRALVMPSQAADGRSARNEARRLADKMSETYLGRKGFASDPVVFVMKKSAYVSELCEGYPDGFDVRQLTSAGKSVVGPRWKDASSIFYTSISDSGPAICEYDTATGMSARKWSFKGFATGACVSPDGTRAAVVLSIHGNPELYLIDIAAGTWTRLTKTPHANEGQPSWSPDGARIAYVSDESRRTHIYVFDLATKKKTRITSSGRQNVDPDWGPDGRIVFISKQDGEGKIAIVDPDKGASSVEIVQAAGTWEHPSWSRDARHVAATSGGRLFVVDTLGASEGGDKPRQMFSAPGRWITPSWRRK